MKIAHDALVMVLDGEKMLLLRNEGDSEHPNLKVEDVSNQDNPADRDQGTAPPGRTGSGTARSAMEETDYHQQAEDRFAVDAVELLNRRALSNDYEQLLIVASPMTLGVMRKKYHKTLEERLVGEIPKTMTGHPINEIEDTIAKA